MTVEPLLYAGSTVIDCTIIIPLGGLEGASSSPLRGDRGGSLFLMLLLLVLSVFGNLALANVGKAVVLVVLRDVETYLL